MSIANINKDYSISFTRAIAMLSIFLCHILQAYNNILGGWLDVGVQIFFFLSGYLYGNKIIINIKNFYCKNIFKILIPYYIFITFILIALYIIGQTLTINDIINALILKSSIPGTQHLWFIRFILICYLFIPIFQKILNLFEKFNRKHLLLYILLFVVLIELFFSGFVRITGAWFVCYFGGMAYSKLEKMNLLDKFLLILIFLFAIFLSFIRIYAYYNLDLSYCIYRYIWCYQHIFLGITIFIFARTIYLKIQDFLNLKKILLFSDKYSYYFYIVHYSLIVGCFSLIQIITNKLIACISIFVCVSVLSLFLHFLSVQLSKKWGDIICVKN